jgi:hypothetical protein
MTSKNPNPCLKYILPDVMKQAQQVVGIQYTDEELAVTAVTFAVLSLAMPVNILPSQIGELHATAQLANTLLAGWLTEAIRDGMIDPITTTEYWYREFGHLMIDRDPYPPASEDAPKEDDVKPMTKEQFTELWGPE